MQRFPSVFFICLSLLLLACSSSQITLPRLPDNGTILAFGDSLTFGTGAGAGQSYPDVLEPMIRRKVIRSGVPGETSAEGLKRLSAALKEARPNLVIVCHGGNDILRRMDPARTAQNLRLMIHIIRESGASAVLVAVPQPGLILKSAPFYEDIARELKVPLEGQILQDILSDGTLKYDYIHPNGQGYARMAKAIASLLRRYGAIES